VLDASEVLDKRSRSKKQVDSASLIEIESGTSSPTQSSDSSDLDDATLSLIYNISTSSKTPQKAPKSVPKKIDLINQQPPKPTQQNNSEPTQNLPLSTSDQPSSSSNIQILDQPPLNILESEFIEAELLKISKEMQDLVQLIRVPTLSIVYKDQWSSLKSKASELINDIS